MTAPRRTSILVFVLTFLSTSAFAQVTAIRAGRLVDPDTGVVSATQIILVEGDKLIHYATDTGVWRDYFGRCSGFSE